MAHTYFVFDVADESPITVSVEARREKGETYNAWLGLFNEYELSYVWATEEDQTIRRVVDQHNDLYNFPLLIRQEAVIHLIEQLAPRAGMPMGPGMMPGGPIGTMPMSGTPMMGGFVGAAPDQTDARFMTRMIAHHQGAIDMAALANERANHQEVKDLAASIITSQSGAIQTMQGWLTDWYER